ncbi:MAG: DUF4296 domain-containing protein [Tannerellaceae bacterium]|jgi:hypothetical protein|nr:DUF4296 domain-containing protein [Tannerellaceae bacterium]
MAAKQHIYAIAILTIAILAASCSKVPSGLLSEKKMKAIMIDMQLAEQIISENYQTYSDSMRKAAVFESVFRKHHTTQAIFDSSLVWYGKNLNIMIQVIDMAIKDIDKNIVELSKANDIAIAKALGDTANIWPDARLITLQPHAVFNGTRFELKPPTPFISGSTFTLSMNVWGLRPDMTHMPEIRLAAEMQDTTMIINQTLQTDGRHSITLQTSLTKPTGRIYGYIRMNNIASDYYKIYIDSIRLVRTNYGTETPGAEPY